MTNAALELKDLEKILISTQTELQRAIQRHYTQMKEICAQKSTLQSQIAELEDELVEKRADNDLLVLRCEDLEHKNWELRVERREMLDEGDGLFGERERLIEAKGKLVEKKEALVADKEALVGEKEYLVADKERLVGEKEQLILENAEQEDLLHRAENEKAEARNSQRSMKRST